MKIKERIQKIKKSKLVQDAVSRLEPTWDMLKNNGGYKILLISTLIMGFFIPTNFIIGLLSKLFIGTSLFEGLSLMGIITSITSGYFFYDTGNIVMLIIFGIIAVIIGLITFIITTFLVSNASFRAFKILVEENRVVRIEEYFKLSVTDIVTYSCIYFVNVILPIIVISVVGIAIDFIPYIKGTSIANLIVSIITYALVFRFFGIMLKVDHEEAVTNFAPYWLTFAVVVYIVQATISLSILVDIANIIFILYSVLILVGNKETTVEKLEIE